MRESKNIYKKYFSDNKDKIGRPAYGPIRLFIRIKAYLRLFAANFSANLKGAMEYRANFIMQMFGMMLNNAAFLMFWNVLISKTGNLGEYGIREILFLWGMAAAAFGFANIVFGNIHYLGEIIKRGELDAYLLQPKDVFFNTLTSRTVFSAWGDLAFGIILLAYLAWGDPLRGLMLGIFVLSGGILFCSVFTMAESLTFFLGNAGAISKSIFELMITATLYPETIFGPGIRWIFYSILPAGFICFIPLHIFTLVSWKTVPLVVLTAFGYLLLAYFVFRAGLRRYESGNLMGTRI